MADPLYTQCDSIDADLILSASEKARQKASLKAAGIRDALIAGWVFPKTFGFSKSGATYSVAVFSVTVETVHTAAGDRDLLTFNGTATKNGLTIKNADGSPLWPIRFYNPPCLIGGGGTVARNGRTYTYDLAALAQSLVSDVVSG